MGKSKIKADSYVKLTIENSNLFGKVSALEEGKATIVLPTGLTHSFEVDKTDVEVIEQEEYNKEVRTIVDSIAKSISLDIGAIEKQVADINKSLADVTKERDEAQNALKVAEGKLAEIEAEKLAAERLAALKSVEAVEAVDADESKATAALKSMPKAEFDAIIKTATIAFKKLTEVRQTSLPASTDQSQTNKTKLTQADEKAVEAAKEVASAKVEEKASVEGAANASEGASALENLISASIKSRYSKKNK